MFMCLSACPPTWRCARLLADASGSRTSVKAGRAAQTKHDRLNAAKQQRDQKRAAALEQRRSAGPPRVVALLPLSADVDVERLWASLLASCSVGLTSADDVIGGGKAAAAAAGGMEIDAAQPAANGSSSGGVQGPCPPLATTTLSLVDRRRVRYCFLPPPAARDDPLAIVELGRSAECILLAMPGDLGTATIDEAGSMALGVLRTLGLPTVVALVQSPAAADGGKNALKERSAAKKHATNALLEQVGWSK
jgi:hypothetical protein